MTLRLKALRSLRWNLKLSAVVAWLIRRPICWRCEGSGYAPTAHMAGISYAYVRCWRCKGRKREKRGITRIFVEPERVIAEQTAAAEGVFV